jgi:hypothetical protein
MKPETRQLAIGGLIIVAIFCVAAAAWTKIGEFIPVISTIAAVIGTALNKAKDSDGS